MGISIFRHTDGMLYIVTGAGCYGNRLHHWGGGMRCDEG